MSRVLDFFRERDPRFKDIPDENLTLFIGERYPNFLQDPEFQQTHKTITDRVQLRSEMEQAKQDVASSERKTTMLQTAESLTEGALAALSASPKRILETVEGGIEGAAKLSGLAGPKDELIWKPSRLMDQPVLAIPNVPQQEGKAAQVAAGTANALIDFANFMQTPEGVSYLAGLRWLPAAAKKATLMAISGNMAAQAPGQFNAAVASIEHGDYQEAAKQFVNFAVGTALSAVGGRESITPEKPPINKAVANLEESNAPMTAAVVEDAAKKGGEINAVQEQSPNAIPVRQTPEVSQEMGGQIRGEEKPATTQTKEAPLTPEEHAGLQAELEATQENLAPQTTAAEAMVQSEFSTAESKGGQLPFPKSLPEAPGMPEEPVKASQIIKDMADIIDRPIRVAHLGQSGSTLGIFKPHEEIVRLRRANDIPTASHEIAHALERTHRRALGNGQDIGRAQWTRSLPVDVKNELKALDYDPKQQRAYEGFAEFMRHWLTIGDTTSIAPKSHQWFTDVFLKHNPEIEAGLGKILNQIQLFKQQGSVKRLESLIQFTEPKKPFSERLRTAEERLVTRFIDAFAPLESAERSMSGTGEMFPGASSFTGIARMVSQASGARARQWAIHGMTDFAGNRIGPALREIFGREGIAGDEKNAVLYAVAKRAVELWERGINPGIDLADAKYVIEQLGNPARELASREIADWNQGALNYLADAGGISPELLDRIKLQNHFYVPLFRVFEQESAPSMATGGRRIGDTPQPIKAIKGSGRDIVNPIESMQTHANQIIAVADKVRIARALVDRANEGQGMGKYVEEIPANKVPVQFDINRIKGQLEEAGADLTDAELDSVMTLFQQSSRTPAGGNIVSFVRDGKRRFFELDPELYRAIQSVDFQRIHPLLDATLGRLARITRLGATGIRAGFTLITNPLRDFSTTMLQTEGNPVKAARNLFEHLTKQIGLRDNEIKNLWRATGGELSQPLGLDRASLKRAVDDVMNNTAKQKALNIIKHPIEFAQQALSLTESAPRLGEFSMALQELGWKPGMPVTEDMAVTAANRAAEVTVNFRRAGNWGSGINQIIAFWNPAIQGLSKFTRSHREHKIRSVARGIGLLTIPAIANWWTNKDDPDWQNMPNWLKYGFMNFKLGGEWIRLPLPFEWGMAYWAMPMATLESARKANPKEFTKVFGESIRQLTPDLIPTGITPFAEVAQNKSFFTGRPLIPRGQEDIVPSEQVKPNTTQTARKVASILSAGNVEVSPIQVDHVLNGLSGGLYGDLIGAAELATGQAPSKELREPSDIPVVGRLFVRDSAGAIVDEFYQELTYLEQRKATHTKLDKEDNARAGKYELSGMEEAKLASMRKTARRMAELRKELNSATNREERKRIYLEMRDESAEALDLDRNK